MADSRHYDTVAFDVRDNATMLFFAKTTETGDIDDYLLLVRTIEDDFDESMHIEINDRQFGGHDLLEEAQLIGNALTLRFKEAVEALDGAQVLALTFTETQENLNSIEVGAFRVRLRTDRHVLARSHRHGACHQPCGPGQKDVFVCRLRRRDADDETRG